MSLRSTGIGIGILSVLIGIALLDFVLVEGPRWQASNPENTVPATTQQASIESEGSTPTLVRKGSSTRKREAVPVAEVLTQLGLTSVATTETSILTSLLRATDATTVVLLLNNDRAALAAWIEADNVKDRFRDLKQALQERFSPNVTDLRDETIRPADGPPYDLLTFSDPAISTERILLVRIRTRLYEFHLSALGETIAQQLIEAFRQ